VLGKYMISDRPITEEQWAKERATGDRRRAGSNTAQGLAMH